MDIKSRKAIYITSILGLLAAPYCLHADNNQPTASKTIADTTKGYLSDPARTGSLVGSIIAGSAVANPLAPVLGSVVGFMIGKSSAFSSGSSNRTQLNVYNNRSLIPNDGTQMTNVSGLSGTSVLATIPAEGVTIAENIETTIQTRPTVKLELDENTPDLAAALPATTNGTSNEIVIVEETNGSHLTTSLETIVPTDLVRESEMGGLPTHTTSYGLRVESAGSSNLQKRLADACSNYQVVKTASMNCYYKAQ